MVEEIILVNQPSCHRENGEKDEPVLRESQEKDY